ncbi:MAG: hypothetical protein AABW67_01190 [Nanoarchaeota archaeon]
MKSKKGEKLLSIWWFFVLGVIAGGMVIGVLIYSSADVDIKEIEAGILAERISICLIDNGYLKENILEKEFNVFDFCNLNKTVFEKGSNFYFNISIYDSGSLIFNLTEGSYSFENECSIQEKVEAKDFPKCSQQQDSALLNGKNIQVIILAGSNQNGRKISVA